jgi:hypothetical protein
MLLFYNANLYHCLKRAIDIKLYFQHAINNRQLKIEVRAAEIQINS